MLVRWNRMWTDHARREGGSSSSTHPPARTEWTNEVRKTTKTATGQASQSVSQPARSHPCARVTHSLPLVNHDIACKLHSPGCNAARNHHHVRTHARTHAHSVYAKHALTHSLRVRIVATTFSTAVATLGDRQLQWVPDKQADHTTTRASKDS